MKPSYLLRATTLAAAIFPACVSAGVAGWTPVTRVTALEPTTHGRLLFQLRTEKSTSGCRSKDWYFVDYTGTGPRLMFHVLKDALLMEKPVKVFVTGRCDLDGYSEISAARLLP